MYLFQSVADCIEALIGTYLLDSGIVGAIRVLEWLRVIPAEVSLNLNRPGYFLILYSVCGYGNVTILPGLLLMNAVLKHLVQTQRKNWSSSYLSKKRKISIEDIDYVTKIYASHTLTPVTKRRFLMTFI